VSSDNVEIWKGLIYNGRDLSEYYEISNYGKLLGKRRNKLVTLQADPKGYFCFIGTFGSNNDRKTIKIHRAVAETFIPNLENKPQVNHKDGNKQNDYVGNLEWCTPKENSQHAYKNNLVNMTNRSGTSHYLSRLTDEDIRTIRSLYIEIEGQTRKQLAKRFGVSRSCIERITKNITYKDNTNVQ
jgi:hypothetical protein